MMATSATTQNTIADQASAIPVDAVTVAVATTVTVSPSYNADASSMNGSAAASDSEPTRAGSSSKKGHVRTGSAVKKPASFKAVSVNKTFLASKAAGNGASTPKIGEKSSASASSQPGTAVSSISSRPRLVAKAGSGASFKVGGKPAAAPDPNAVWNKNRPPPVQDTKAMSDEELRKKFGIHMAARLHTDEGTGNANNWADEDDDDEWVPDTISWADGTKTAIPHPEEVPLASEPGPTPTTALAPVPASAAFAQAPDPALATVSAGALKVRSPVPSATSSPSIQPSLPSGKGLVLKGGPEKPTLVAKPPAPPAAVKSPWATLPPIQKASPIEPPLDHGNRFGRDNKFSHQGPKEIAADDFSRSSWRDGPHGTGSRELYNSHSGRYEPAGDRRSFQHNESHSRHPSVLQRPAANMHEMEGAAEPSPPFQTSRTSSQDGPYTRRRGSSNVSGGSGFLHRLGKEHNLPMYTTDLAGARRESVAAGSDALDSPRNFSPRLHSAQPWQPSPRIPHASPLQQPAHTGADSRPGAAEHAQGQANPGEPELDLQRRVVPEADIDFQERFMREKRELAMKRRLEEEAKEEAEKQERIRLKLEALGPAPERKSVKKEKEKEAAATAAKEAATIAAKEAKEAASNDEAQSVNAQQKEGIESSQEVAAEAPTSGDSSEVKISPVPTLIAKSSTPATPPTTTSFAFNTAPAEPEKRDENMVPPYPASSRLLHHDDKRQPWSKPPPTADRFSSWGPKPTSRIWGAPHNDRSLGNGTFSSDLGHSLDPNPAGPPHTHASGPGPIAPPTSSRPQVPPTKPEQYSARPAPIAPPSRQGLAQPGPAEHARKGGLDAWRAPNLIQKQDRTLALENKRRFDEQMRELEGRGMTLEQAQPPIRDTWKAVDVRNDGTRSDMRKLENIVIKGTHESTITTPPFDVTLGIRNASDHVPTSLPTTVNPPATRGSRFFPVRDRDPHSAEPVAPIPEADIVRINSPSPPPPTMVGHPAYDGDMKHPQVSFPPKKPIVKLPPLSMSSLSSPSSSSSSGSVHIRKPLPGRQNPPPPKSPEHTMQENWQDKINSLLTGRKSTAPPPAPLPLPLSTRSIVVDSASKHALDHTEGLPSPANVVLPTTPAIAVVLSVDESSYTTKAMDEICFEEREMGSVPPIRIPPKAPELALLPIPTIHFRTPRSYRLFTSTSKEELPFDQDGSRRVFLPGMKESKHIDIPGSIQPAPPSRPTRGRGGVRGSSSGSRRGGPHKLRDPSGPTYPDSQRSSSHRSRGNSRYNSRTSDNWSRRTSSQTQTS